MKRLSLSIALVSSLIAASAFAQTTAPAAPQTPRVDQREANQQQRIANGAASGQLTAKETQHLEKEQARVDNAEAKAKSDGVVTAKERRQLQRKQDVASADIRRAKHNKRTAGN
ncbi:hypothetical protein [Mitsuaria sp. GD03876]|uniref:hypothetical protein n=1 Tax=Mitsuaria sp. GD03876 TaxID=2975399 RepID=UPI002449A99A|nr:hypothetical protein [Mitsuaria sp. GD03876]MDH0864897.1 hypothetical protein [Mitsuaria sp. GD03876]